MTEQPTNSVVYIPEKITIRTPMHSPLRRGRHAPGISMHMSKQIRMTDAEYEQITKVSHMLGMMPSTFIRWCAAHTAAALIEHTRKVVQLPVQSDK